MRSLSAGEYVIVHTVEDNTIQILRIVHGRRDLYALFDL
jgi:plasmid stabilization system protein ParE